MYSYEEYKRDFVSLHIPHFAMASGVNWDKILEGCYPSYKVEVNAFLDSLEISSSVDITIEKIYEVIKSDENVCDNLKLLYHEAINGSHKAVKSRIRNRIGNFWRGLKSVHFFLLNIICDISIWIQF